MPETKQPSGASERHRGLESVVRLFVSRPTRAVRGDQEPAAARGAEEPAAECGVEGVREPLAELGVNDPVRGSRGSSPERGVEDPVGDARRLSPERGGAVGAQSAFEAGPRRTAVRASAFDVVDPAAEGELPPIEPGGEGLDPIESSLPTYRVGDEGMRAEAAFLLEEQMISGTATAHDQGDPRTGATKVPTGEGPIETPRVGERRPIAERGEVASAGARQGRASEAEHAPEAEEPLEVRVNFAEEGQETASVAPTTAVPVEPPSPRVALLMGAAPVRMRRMLLENLASPLAADGKEVLVVETAQPRDDPAATLEVALDTVAVVTRRSLGISARDLLLRSEAERKEILGRLAAEEGRCALVVIDVELPESILCPRLQFLVDTVIVALTSNESSLYEGYRALRGLSERGSGTEIFVVSIVAREEEAGVFFERFRTIAHDFLKLEVRQGGWLMLPGPEEGARPKPHVAGSLARVLRTAPARGSSTRAHPSTEYRPFFTQLAEWF